MTLPEDVLQRLAALDADLARAIVTLVESNGAPRVRAVAPAEISSYGNHAVIIVTPVKALKRIAGVELVPIGNGRALISLEHPRSVPQLELAVRDAIDRGGVTAIERQTLELIAGILQQTRRSHGMVLEERTIMVLEAKRQGRPA